MKRIKSERVCLTARDKLVFNYLFINRVATVDQIRRDVYKNTAKPNIYARLKKLKRNGLLQTMGIDGVHRFTKAYSLTPFSFTKFVKIQCDETAGVQLKSDSIDHDLTLVDICKVTKQMEMVDEYFTENQSLSLEPSQNDSTWGSLLACRVDGIIKLLVGKDDYSYVGLEYEGSIKSRERCLNKVNSYYLRPDIEAIFFICKDNQILKRFIEIEKEMKPEGRHKLFFAKLDDVLQTNKKMTFKNINGAKIVLQ